MYLTYIIFMKVRYNSKDKIKRDLEAGKAITVYADRTGSDLHGRIVTIPRDLKLTFRRLPGGEITRERNGMLRIIDEKSALQFIWDWRKGAEISE